jgi:hypothetical protein
LTADEAKFLIHQGMPVKFEPQEVERIVAGAVDFFETATTDTRSSGRTVETIVPLSGYVGGATMTRSEGGTGEEELFYAVNFANDEGFALVSADRRLPDEVLVNVDHGSFPESDIENPGFALMMVGAENYARREIAKYERWRDSMEVVMAERHVVTGGDSGPETRRIKYPDKYEERRTPGLPITTYGPWSTTSRITPMVPVEWGQTAPFNSKASQMEGKQVYTGCVATATIQLMAYWQKPSVFHGQTINWLTTRSFRTASAMSNAPANIRNSLADLFWNFGEDVGMDWGEIGSDGSGAESQDGIDVLNAHGFTTTSKQNYNYSPVLNSLNNSRPVYMRGNSHKTEHKFLGINWWSTYKKGHAWLIDGYLRQSRTATATTGWFVEVLDGNGNVIDSYTETTSSTSTENSDFFHNNFGWDEVFDGNDTNGYYSAGLFDTNNGPDLPSTTRADIDGNFIYELEMWTDIR